MTRFLLDSNICIYALKRILGVDAAMVSHPRATIHVSVVTECELRAGVAKSEWPAKTMRVLDAFLAPLQIVELTSDDSRVYAQIRAKLEAAGTPIGDLDQLIAAQAIARKLTLVTHNQREFKRVPGLHLDDWVST